MRSLKPILTLLLLGTAAALGQEPAPEVADAAAAAGDETLRDRIDHHHTTGLSTVDHGWQSPGAGIRCLS